MSRSLVFGRLCNGDNSYFTHAITAKIVITPGKKSHLRTYLHLGPNILKKNLIWLPIIVWADKLGPVHVALISNGHVPVCCFTTWTSIEI